MGWCGGVDVFWVECGDELEDGLEVAVDEVFACLGGGFGEFKVELRGGLAVWVSVNYCECAVLGF